MNAKEVAERNKILEFRIGSHLYGTATPSSDEDFAGVFMPEIEQVFGLETIEQVDFSNKSKDADGRNTQDAVDKTLYEIRKFVRLAMANNPNILEMLFINKENLIYIQGLGHILLKHRHLFPHAGLKERFLGYAFSQKHKMIIRTDAYRVLENAYDWIQEFISDDDEKRKIMLIQIMDRKLPFFQEKRNHIVCGDLNFEKSHQLRRIEKAIKERLGKATNRKQLITKYGYDTKFGSHLIRLIVEGIELLKTGELQFPLKKAELIRDIKQGKYSLKSVLDMADELEREIHDLAIITSLPRKPRYKEIQNLLISLMEWALIKNRSQYERYCYSQKHALI